jgi:hypothetical protein
MSDHLKDSFVGTAPATADQATVVSIRVLNLKQNPFRGKQLLYFGSPV